MSQVLSSGVTTGTPTDAPDAPERDPWGTLAFRSASSFAAGMPRAICASSMTRTTVDWAMMSRNVRGFMSLFDGVARHTPEGYAFQKLAEEKGFKAAVKARDEPFGDAGPSTFKG